MTEKSSKSMCWRIIPFPTITVSLSLTTHASLHYPRINRYCSFPNFLSHIHIIMMLSTDSKLHSFSFPSVSSFLPARNSFMHFIIIPANTKDKRDSESARPEGIGIAKLGLISHLPPPLKIHSLPKVILRPTMPKRYHWSHGALKSQKRTNTDRRPAGRRH